MNLRYLLKMKHLAQNPPSMGRVKLALGVVAICLVIAAVEWLFTR